MKKAVWSFVMVVPAMLAWGVPSQAGHPCRGGFGAGSFCTGLFSGIHAHGPLYNYGPFPYGYGSDPYGTGAGAGGCDDGCGMPWKNGCGLFNWKCWGGLHGKTCDSGCDTGCDTGCSSGCGTGCGLSLGHGWLKGKLHHKSGGCDTGCSTGGCDAGCATGGCAANNAPTPVSAAPTAHPVAYPQMAYGSYYAPQPSYGMPAYGSVTAYGYTPAPSYVAPRPTVMPVSYGYPAYGSYYMGR